MAGVSDLHSLLRSMQPQLLAEAFVFLSFSEAHYGDHAELKPIASISEKEGVSLVVSRATADRHGHSYDSVMRCISLNVHSSLEATGLTAAFSSALAGEDISANVIAGYYHDHIFVPESLATRALEVLLRLAAQADV